MHEYYLKENAHTKGVSTDCLLLLSVPVPVWIAVWETLLQSVYKSFAFTLFLLYGKGYVNDSTIFFDGANLYTCSIEVCTPCDLFEKIFSFILCKGE